MATVPKYNSFQVTPNTLPQTQFRAAPVHDVAGQQAQQMGRSMQQFGGEVGRIALDMQNQANQLRVTDATNQAKEAALRAAYDKDVGFTNLKGVNALDRPDGKALADEYTESLQKQMQGIAAGLGNDAQRLAFSQNANDILFSVRSQATQHEAQEYKTYALSVAEGVQSTAMRDISLNWNNPGAVDSAITRIKSETYRQAQLLGKSAEWQEAQARKLASGAHKLALVTALESNDPLYADGYLSKYGKDMEADDILAVRGLITKTIDLQVGDSIGAEVFATYAPEIAPNDFSRLTNIVMGIESNGRRYGDDGQLLEGPVTRYGTAKGEMQVLDGTNKDPGFGVTPAQDDSPAERARVGRDYLGAMLKEYKGDVGKALAAYNWGPGNVDKATKAHGANWLAHAPKETRDYVARALNRFGTGAGAAPKPTLMEMLADLRAQPELANNPERLKHAEARVKADFKAMNDGIEQRQGEALDAAYQEVYANGGNFAALPPSVRMAIPGDKLGGVMTFAEKVSKNGGTVHSPEAWAAVLSLPKEQLAQLSPNEFFRQFRPVLDDAHLEKGYALLDDAKGVSGEKHLEIITTATRIKNAAITAGILPEKGTPDKKELGAFTQFSQHIDNQVRQFERIDLQGKRKANSEELQTIIDGVFLDKAFVPSTLWFDREEPLALMDPKDQASAYVKVDGADVSLSSIPMDQRALIASKLQARGLPVTEQAIATLWVKAGKPSGTTATGSW